MIMKYSDFLLDEQFNINNVIYRFKNKINGKVYIGQTAVPYGLHKGNLSRNIKLNIQKNKLGFTKNGSIWSTISPTERGSYY